MKIKKNGYEPQKKIIFFWLMQKFLLYFFYGCVGLFPPVSAGVVQTDTVQNLFLRVMNQKKKKRPLNLVVLMLHKKRRDPRLQP